MFNTVFCLMGPTASGKTARALELVQQFPMEIISIDSTMIYREMNIGSAKPDATELAKAPHHLIDILNPPEAYSAAQCCTDVTTLCQAIFARNKIPLLVGGTMMYFNALQKGLSSLPEANETVRQSILQQANEHGWAHMHKHLAKVDALSAARIHQHDTQRIQRALEVYLLTNKPMSSLWDNDKTKPVLQFSNLMLMPDVRANLHARIALRFKQMLEKGLIEEVDALTKKWNLTDAHPSLRSVGYRQVASYLRGEYPYDALFEKGVAATRQLAKRQLTWLRHWPEKIMFSAEAPAIDKEIVAKIRQILDNAQ